MRSPYPNRLAYVPVIAALAAVTAGFGIARAAQQGYTRTAWAGALLGAAAAAATSLVGTPRWRAAFSRGYMALAAVAVVGLALVQTRHYPRAEGLLFDGGVLGASAVLMGWDELSRRRRLSAFVRASTPGPHALERYLIELEALVEDLRAAAPRLSEAIRALKRRRRSEAAAALGEYLPALREYLDEVRRICPLELAALRLPGRPALERAIEFWTGVATDLAAGRRARWKCRWQRIVWELVETDRETVSAIDMLAAQLGVVPPPWFAAHRRRLRRMIVL